MIVITVIISLYYIETNQTVLLTNLTVLFTLLLHKSGGKIKLGEFESDQINFAK